MKEEFTIDIPIKKYKAWDPVSRTFSPEVTLNNLFLLEGSSIEDRKRMGEVIIWITCTGLLDIEKKEMWEGDILEQEFMNEFGSLQKHIGVMAWNSRYGAFMGRFKDLPTVLNYEVLPKVIGNIWQNPDLINKKVS